MKKRKKKKLNNKMKIFMYCRVGTPEQIVTQDRKNETFIVQKDKKVLISQLFQDFILIIRTIYDIIIYYIME